MANDISNIKNSIIAILFGIVISLITYIFISQKDTLDRLDISVHQLEKTISLLAINLQVADDRSKENERELRELMRDYAK